MLCFVGFGRDLFEQKRPEVLMVKEFIETPVVNHTEFLFIVKPTLIGGSEILELDKKLRVYFLLPETDSSNI